jgi:hypothetical protein
MALALADDADIDGGGRIDVSRGFSGSSPRVLAQEEGLAYIPPLALNDGAPEML